MSINNEYLRSTAENEEKRGDKALEERRFNDALRFFKNSIQQYKKITSVGLGNMDDIELKKMRIENKIHEVEKAITKSKEQAAASNNSNSNKTPTSSDKNPASSRGENGRSSKRENKDGRSTTEGRTDFSFNDIPEEITPFLTFFGPGDLKFGFDEVIGLDAAKAAVQEYVINPRLYPEEYNYDFLESSGVLLEGPPGTGKTTFAKALSKELNQPFVLVNTSGLVNCYIGETARNIDKIFDFLREYAAKNQCCVTVFFDELEEIAKSRGGDDRTSQVAVPALLRNLDGIIENKGLLIVANTNYKDLLDRAIIDRFRRTIHIPLPDAKSREQLMRLKLKDLEPKYINMIDFNIMAQETEGMSGRQLTYLCDELKHFISNSKVRGIELEDLTSHFLDLKRNYQ